MATPVAEALTPTAHDMPQVTQPDIQEERREDPIDGGNDRLPEAQLEGESKGKSKMESSIAEASSEEVPGQELRPPGPKPLLSTVDTSYVGVIGNSDNAEGRQSGVSPNDIYDADSSEFEFQDVHVPFDVCPCSTGDLAVA